jgi:hypothetical protein
MAWSFLRAASTVEADVPIETRRVDRERILGTLTFWLRPAFAFASSIASSASRGSIVPWRSPPAR